MSTCTDKSDDATLLSSSINPTAVDDMSKCINKVTLEDVNIPPCDINGGEEEDMNSEKKCTSCDQKLEHTKTHEIGHNSASSNANTTTNRSGDIVGDTKEVSICANCGKEGASNMCNTCKSVKYCNAACKKKHKTKHKKACERRVAELHDVKLFKQPPPLDDCPICFQRLPTLSTGRRFQSCCGKTICSGCIHAVLKRDKGVALCSFCRSPEATSNNEVIKRMMKRVDKGDAEAITNLGFYYSNGSYGLAQDHAKALELFHQAAELGSVTAYSNIGVVYSTSRDVARDMKKARYYYELGAIEGDAVARHNLGAIEGRAGYVERAVKHYMIAIGGGDSDSLKVIQKLYSKGYVTKDKYTTALRAYQEYLGEVKSDQRDEAAAASEINKYIE